MSIRILYVNRGREEDAMAYDSQAINIYGLCSMGATANTDEFNILTGVYVGSTIVEYAKENKPEMIVMGTRGAGKKEKELIGSVTAEVLDSCRLRTE